MAAPFAIPGVTPDSVKNVKTEVYTSGKPFPFAVGLYEKGLTGSVTSIGLKTFKDKECFSLKVSNHGYTSDILINTDPREINPRSKKSPEEQLQANLNTLTRFIAHMDIMNRQGMVDESLFGRAVGKIVSFDAQNKVYTSKKDGREYVNTQGYYKGEAPVLLQVCAPVVSMPVASPAQLDDDIPF